MEKYQKVKCNYFIQKNTEKTLFKHLSGKQVFEVDADIKEAELPSNENQFNYRNYLLSRNINRVAQINKIIQIKSEKGTFFQQISHQICENLNYKFESLPNPLKNYARALILRIINDDFQITIN